MTTLERLALALAGVVGLTLIAVGAVAGLVSSSRRRGAAEAEADAAEAARERLAAAASERARHLPTDDQVDAWMD
jgi:type II secretory pathway pseudopilin PulG